MTGLGGFVKAMHCKELTTTIPSLSLSLSLSLVLSPSLSRRSRVAALCLAPQLFSSRSRFPLTLSLSFSSVPARFVITSPSFPLCTYPSIFAVLPSPFPALLSLPFSTALLLEEGAMGRARYLYITREQLEPIFDSRDLVLARVRDLNHLPRRFL